jgi:hypothetical protein
VAAFGIGFRHIEGEAKAADKTDLSSRGVGKMIKTGEIMKKNDNGRYSYQATLAASQKVNWRIEDIIGGDKRLDPQFKSLLKHHWMEEAQHAKLDTLMIESLTQSLTEREIDRAVDEYLEMGGFLDDGLKAQTQFDLESLERTIGRKLTDREREKFMEIQHQANRWTYIGSGMTHPNFLATLGDMMPEARKRIEQISPVFC